MGGVTLFMVLSSHLDIVQRGRADDERPAFLTGMVCKFSKSPRQRTHNQRRNRFDQVPQIKRFATLFCAVRFNSHVLRLMLQKVFQSACPHLSQFGAAKWRRQAGRAKATNMILIYPVGRFARANALFPHTDTKILPMQSSSCCMARAVANPELCIEFGAEIRSLPTLRPGSQAGANNAQVWSEPKPGALRHRDPILPIHQPSGVLESLGHHRGGNREAALYFVRCGHVAVREIDISYEPGVEQGLLIR
jgi:hypothetical protein